MSCICASQLATSKGIRARPRRRGLNGNGAVRVNRLFGSLKRWLASESDSSSGVAEAAMAFGTEVSVGSPSETPGSGTVRVGRSFIVVSNPQGGGALAVCVVPDDERLTVRIDGRRVVGRVALTRDQEISVTLVHKPPVRRFTVEVAEDRLQASVRATVRPGARRVLQEVGPVHEAVLCIVEDEWRPEDVPASEVLDLLKQRGLKGEPDLRAVAELCSAQLETALVVLRGKPPVVGRGERYRPCGMAANWVEQQGEAPWVAKGALVGQLDPAVPPVPGRDVMGQEVRVFEDGGRQVLLRGVRDAGGTVIAVRPGRILFTRARIDVVPELVLEGDLTSRDGQVIFDGDVAVRGSLQEGALVKASGRVVVSGDVLESTVEAGRDVEITGAVLRANIHGGLARALYTRAHVLVTQMLEDWGRFRGDYRQLLEHTDARPDLSGKTHLLAGVLLSRRYHRLDDSFAAAMAWEDSYYLRHDPCINALVQQIRSKWHRDVRQGISPDDIDQFEAAVDEAKEHLRLLLTEALALVRAHSISSSQVDATGDIVVHGVGVFSSHMESGRDILVEGVVRGGFVLAERMARMGELGSPVGVESSVRVNSPDGLIRIGVRHGNTLIDLAGRRSRSAGTEHNVKWGEQSHAVQGLSG